MAFVQPKTQKELGDWLGISDRQVRNLESGGVLPGKRGRAGYDLQENILSYIRYLQANQKKGSRTMQPGEDYDPENPDDLQGGNRADEEIRYSQLRNDKLELQVLELARKLAPVELLQEYTSKLAQAVGAILDSIPGNVKRRHPKIKANELGTIKLEVTKAMNAASKITIDLDNYQGLSEGD